MNVTVKMIDLSFILTKNQQFRDLVGWLSDVDGRNKPLKLSTFYTGIHDYIMANEYYEKRRI